MAGYRIEYSGSAVQRKDQPESTVNSSVTQTTETLASNSLTEFNFTAWPSFGSPYPSGVSIMPPLIYGDWTATSQTHDLASGIGFVNEVLVNSGSANIQYYQSFSGTRFEKCVIGRNMFPQSGLIRIELRMSTGNNWVLTHTRASPTPIVTTTLLSGITGEGWITRSTGWINPGPGSLTLYQNGQNNLTVDYVRVYSQTSSPLTMTFSTFTNGVNATGGSAINASVATFQGGTSGITTPAKEFGLLVKHDGGVISQLKYLPPADVSEPAILSMQDSGIITATDTSISAEGEGLGGSDKIRAVDTSIIVEEHDNATEN